MKRYAAWLVSASVLAVVYSIVWFRISSFPPPQTQHCSPAVPYLHCPPVNVMYVQQQRSSRLPLLMKLVHVEISAMKRSSNSSLLFSFLLWLGKSVTHGSRTIIVVFQWTWYNCHVHQTTTADHTQTRHTRQTHCQHSENQEIFCGRRFEPVPAVRSGAFTRSPRRSTSRMSADENPDHQSSLGRHGLVRTLLIDGHDGSPSWFLPFQLINGWFRCRLPRGFND